MMHEAAREFVERMGLHLEADGMPRSAGRIFGYMMLAEAPCSLDDLAEALQVSKASASTNARLLEQVGLLERAIEVGDRRDFYRMRTDAWERMLLVARRRWEGMQDLLSQARAGLPEELHCGRVRICEAARFHTLLMEEADSLLERWREMKAEQAEAAVGGPA
jgi:DNA-binding transcriptional regulator GbsR (MarR family)